MVATIKFLGAVGTVTGSRFLVAGEKSRVLVDCGLYQGLKELRLKNWEPFPLDAATIDAVVISHAHLDHCGYLPKLVREGFDGPIYCTPNTAKLAAIVLRDAAKLQVEDAKYAKKKGYSKHKEPLALFNAEEAELAIAKFEVIPFHETKLITDEIKVTFHRSGHILGSSFVDLIVAGKRIVFTGDIGRGNHAILTNPDLIPAGEISALVTESTYGNRTHPTSDDSLAQAINRTIKRHGSVLIPAFAVDRTEIMLMTIKRLIKSEQIPKLPVYVDSPMALSALRCYREAIANKSPEIRPELFDLPEDPFDSGSLFEATTVEDSKALNDLNQPSIIISASGMATGGRVVHHLENMLPNPNNAILLVGYQAAGTRGQHLLSGATSIKMFGKWIDVRAEIVQIKEFSVHADSQELLNWFKSADTVPKAIFAVHGESESADTFAKLINEELGWNSIVPKLELSYELN
ncbi:MAG: MBL fold metallo-hydrolase RNA specificity domain-containing protein [Candidatus Nanopelagicaceae bacterium]